MLAGVVGKTVVGTAVGGIIVMVGLLWVGCGHGFVVGSGVFVGRTPPVGSGVSVGPGSCGVGSGPMPPLRRYSISFIRNSKNASQNPPLDFICFLLCRILEELSVVHGSIVGSITAVLVVGITVSVGDRLGVVAVDGFTGVFVESIGQEPRQYTVGVTSICADTVGTNANKKRGDSNRKNRFILGIVLLKQTK
jgi:hypothetical protein